jgi:hypothetical protein
MHPASKVSAVIAFVVTVCCSATQASAQTGSGSGVPWHWVEVEALGRSPGWTTTSGTAAVHIHGRRFHADLQLGPNNVSGANVSLDGLINRGKIRATEVLLNTDAEPTTVTGTLRRQPIGPGFFTERVVFHGGQSGEASFLGLWTVTKATAPHR